MLQYRKLIASTASVKIVEEWCHVSLNDYDIVLYKQEVRFFLNCLQNNLLLN
jgi:hypothetical protein